MQGSVQSLEWGLDRRSVISKSWWVVAGERTLVSEGVWFWHPGERKIRGYFTAVQMPVEFLEYTTLFQDGRMVSDVVTWSPTGERADYRETWEPDGANRYEWTVFENHEGHFEKSMGGTFARKR
jgi:hypothetical protein